MSYTSFTIKTIYIHNTEVDGDPSTQMYAHTWASALMPWRSLSLQHVCCVKIEYGVSEVLCCGVFFCQAKGCYKTTFINSIFLMGYSLKVKLKNLISA